MTVQETSMENGKKVDEAALDDQKLHERLNVDEDVETYHGESEYSESESENKNVSEKNADNEEGDKLLDEAERVEAKTEDKITDEKMTGIPIDTGWAWAVLAGNSYIIFCSITVACCNTKFVLDTIIRLGLCRKCLNSIFPAGT